MRFASGEAAPGGGAQPDPAETRGGEVKPVSPSRKARRCPRMSPNRAPATTSAAKAIVYIATISGS
jgi:hypothetical protein